MRRDFSSQEAALASAVANKLASRTMASGRAASLDVNRLASAVAKRLASLASPVRATASPAPLVASAGVNRLASAIARLASPLGRVASRFASGMQLSSVQMGRLASQVVDRLRLENQMEALASAVAKKLASPAAEPAGLPAQEEILSAKDNKDIREKASSRSK